MARIIPRERQRAPALQMERATRESAGVLGKAGSCGVLEMLQRPASEGEPYSGRATASSNLGNSQPLHDVISLANQERISK